MNQSKTIYNRNVLNVLKFYENIGINLQINLCQNEITKDLLALTKHNNKKSLESFIVNKEKKLSSFEDSADKIDELENSFKNSNGCNLKKTATNFINFQGSKKADILFIDGTPDTEEDKFGESFVTTLELSARG